jgi:hypothetical protein
MTTRSPRRPYRPTKQEEQRPKPGVRSLIRRDAVVRSPRLPDFVIAAGTQFERWRHWCPYGIWTCADGREVLFNRDYVPIFERRPGALGRVADHAEWVAWVRQDFFFNDTNSPVSWWSVPSWEWQPVVIRINKLFVKWALSPLPPRPRNKRASSPRRRRLWEEREQAQQIRRARKLRTPREIVRKHNIQGKLRNYLLHGEPQFELRGIDEEDQWRRYDRKVMWMARCLHERDVPHVVSKEEAFIMLRESSWNRHRGKWRGDDKLWRTIELAWAEPFTPWSQQRRLSGHPTEEGRGSE